VFEDGLPAFAGDLPETQSPAQDILASAGVTVNYR